MTKVFSVYDSKALAFISPIFAPTIGVALRMFEAAANDQNHEFHKHAGDYTLFLLGEWDEDNGQFTNDNAHTNLGTALSMIKPVEIDQFEHIRAAHAEQRNVNGKEEQR